METVKLILTQYAPELQAAGAAIMGAVLWLFGRGSGKKAAQAAQEREALKEAEESHAREVEVGGISDAELDEKNSHWLSRRFNEVK